MSPQPIGFSHPAATASTGVKAPRPEVKFDADAAAAANQPEPSLAVTQPHVAPAQATKVKVKRTLSTAALKRKNKAAEKGAERAQKLDKRRSGVDGRKDAKKRAKALWD